MVVLVQAVVWTRLHAASQTSDNVRLSNQQSKHVRIIWRKTLTWNWANAHIKFPRLLQSVHFLSLLADQRRVSALTQPLTFPPGSCAVAKHGLNSSAWMFWLLFVVCNGSDSQLRFVMAPASTVYCFIHCACMLVIRWERDWKTASKWNILQW